MVLMLQDGVIVTKCSLGYISEQRKRDQSTML
jgi:hypothetical protein